MKTVQQMTLRTPAVIPVGTDPVRLCAEDSRRVFLRIQHQGTARVLLGDTAAQLVRCDPGYEEPFAEACPTNEIWAVSTSGMQNMLVWEGVKR